MTRPSVFLIIPVAIMAGLLIYCWTIILSTDTLATWRHYAGLALFVVLVILYFRSVKWAVIGTGFYLLLAAINVLSITAEIRTTWIRVGPVETPPIQPLSLGLLILFAILNFDTLTNTYLNYKGSEQT